MSCTIRKAAARSSKLCRALRSVIETLEQRLCLSAGAPDPTFGVGGTAFGELFPGGGANATAIQAGSKIIAAGYGVDANGNNELALARFNLVNGSLDRTFGVDGRVATPLGTQYESIQAVAVQTDGDIVVAGYSEPTSEITSSFIVARYLPNGALDNSFGVKGIASISFLGSDFASSLVIQTNGDIVVAGSTGTSPNANKEFALARLTKTGALDTTFGTQGKVLQSFPGIGAGVESLLIQSNGDLIAAGSTYSNNNSGIFYTTLVRYLPSGQLDKTFGVGGIANSSTIQNSGTQPVVAALQANGQIVVASSGNQQRGPYVVDNTLNVIRFNANGSQDNTFGTDGLATYNSGSSTNPVGVMIQKNGDIVVAGTIYFGGPVDSPSDFLFVRFSAAGVLGTVTQTPLVGGTDAGYATAGAAVEQDDQRIVIVGQAYFGSNGGDFALARYTLSGTLDGTFGYHGTVQQPNGITGLINAIAVTSGGKILIAGTEASPDPGLQPTDAALVEYNADGTINSSFGADGKLILRIGDNAAWNSIAVESNGDIVVAGVGQVDGVNEFAVARYLPAGQGDPAFGTAGLVLSPALYPTSGGQTATAVAVQSNGDIVVGGNMSPLSLFGASAFAFQRFLPNGTLDKSFANGEQQVSFTKPGGVVNLNGTLSSIAILKSGAILVAGTVGTYFETTELTPSGTLSGFGSSGSVRTAFADGAATLNAMAVDPITGDVVEGGYVTLEDGQTEYALARYTPSGKLDPTFGTGGELTANITGGDEIESLAIQSDGKIVVGGISFGAASITPGAIHPDLGPIQQLYATVARFTSTGLDSTFGQQGITLLDQGVQQEFFNTSCVVAIQPNGDILAGDIDLHRLLGK